MTIVSAIITGHREGLLAGPGIASFLEAVTAARQAGIEVETVALLDRPDSLTMEMFSRDGMAWDKLVVADYGDPARSRNRAIAESGGPYVTFLDADDLWGYNWIVKALDYSVSCDPMTVLHSEVNIVFGDLNQLWFHEDSTDASFDPGYLAIGNYWDALAFCRRDIYIETPMRHNDLNGGFGHEDWDWNNLTYGKGYAHRPVPGTMHFKRRRAGSQMVTAEEKDVIPRPSEARLLKNWSARTFLDANGNSDEPPTRDQTYAGAFAEK